LEALLGAAASYYIKMSRERGFLEREELISNAACIGEDINLAEINAMADKSRIEYVSR
jgi:hypothetical protein